MNRKIRILNVITGGIKRDGISLSQLDYMRKIDKDKFSIDIAAVHNNLDDVIEEFKEAGCNTIKLPDRKKNLIKYIKAMNKLMKDKNYDIIHVHGSSAIMSIELMLAKKNKIKTRIVHSRNTKTNNLMIHRVLMPVFKNSYNVALSCGDEAGKWLFKNKKFTVLHNGKDLEKYKFNEKLRDKYRKKYKLDKCKVLGTVGNCNDQKNQFYLIDVFNEAYNKDNSLRLIIIGDGPNKDKLEEKAARLSLSKVIYFLGRIDNVNEMLNAMDIMLLPSLYEGLPNVVLEWQANGLPCLISDKVTKECSVYQDTKFISIDNGTIPWVNAINDIGVYDNKVRKVKSKEGCQGLIDNSYEINNNVKLLENIYIDEYNKERK